MNPVDRSVYQRIKEPEGYVLGAEGTGVIHKLGEGVQESLLGKRVSFLGSAYQKYNVHPVENLIIYEGEIDLKSTANAYVNPVTALA